MKKVQLIMVFLFVLRASFTFAQTVNGVPLEDIEVKYVRIVGTSKFLKNEVTIEIDFGQKNKFFTSKDTRLLDNNGKDIVFHSMIDALNFMDENGYMFVEAYAITIGSQNVYHYLLKKTKP